MSEPGKSTEQLTFVRPDPTRFVLLVARAGRGSGGIVPGTENFKPAGTEWATERDLRDAGYVPVEDAVEAVRIVELAGRGRPPGENPQELGDAVGEAMDLLGVEA